jgi:thioesterase domain-containing protein
LDAYDHQELPMDRLKVRSANYGDAAFAPAFQAEFSFQQVGPLKERMGDVQIQSLELPSGLAASELSLWVKDLGTDFSAAVEFKSELFELRTIVHWLACFQELLGNLLDNPELSIAMVPCVPEGGALEQSSLNALLVSGAPLPRWLSEEIGVTSWSEVTSVNLVEPTGSPVPLNCFGALRLQMPFRNLAAPSRVRLTHGGELQQELLSDPESVHAQFEAPQTDTEIQVAQLFGDLLGRTIGANDDYFEQGGNSLLAVRLFKEIHDRFGVSLPFTTILDAPTPRLLAAQVRAGVPKRQGSLVTLKTGPRREKLFLVHDGDGETLLYRNLARRMPPELGVIGLMPRSSGSLLIDTSISAIAAHFVREIRSAQPEGPYLVGGLCAGGLIAFEICRQLRQADRPVALLVLLDAAPPFAHARGASVERWNRFRSLTKGMSPSARVLTGTAVQASRKIWGFVEHATTSRTRQLSSLLRVELLRRWAAHSMPWPAWVTPPTFRELFDHMEHEYRGEALALPSLLVRATTGVGGDMASRELLIDPDFEWPKLITNEIQVADVPGGHSTMLREPNVDATAMVVVRAVERALAPYPYYEPGPSSAPASVRRRH